MKKSLLMASLVALFSVCLIKAQHSINTYNNISGTPPAPEAWHKWFNSEVEKFKENRVGAKSLFAQHTIPVVFHIMHNGQTIGTAPNLALSKLQSQINLLNQVFAGTASVTPAIAHYSNFVANTGITFCLALNDPTNAPLFEAGVNRIDVGTVFSANTTTMTSDAQFKNFMETVIKPNTIWDPNKYLNIWISAVSPSISIMGYATYPTNTTLQGLGAAGTFSTDGVWVNAGTIGSPSDPGSVANYNHGKILAREIAHWLGVLNIWGDANCGTDYCSDTPPATGPNTVCPSAYPYKINSCHPSSSPGGEMTMNIMDYTPDACRYMFTNEQAIRMQTAMSQCYYRYDLGSHALCTSTVVPPGALAVAQFSFSSPPCFGKPFTPVNYSTGNPAPTFTWNLIPNTATVNSGYYVAQPSFNLANQGTYTLELYASNSVTHSSVYTLTFTTINCPLEPKCLDTLFRINRATDTLMVFNAPTSTAVAGCGGPITGFLTGSNCYKDKEFAQFYSAAQYSNTTNPQISGVIVLFNRAGTVAKSPSVNVQMNVWSGSFNGGPVALLKQLTVPLVDITATTVPTWSTIGSPTNQVVWAANPSYTFSAKDVYAYKFEYDQAYPIPTSGFYVGIEVPWFSSQDSVQIFSNNWLNAPLKDSIVFVRNSSNSWKKIKDYHKRNVQLAIYPILSCKPPVGLSEEAMGLFSNVNLMPNPNTGQFQIITTLNQPQNLKLRVYNYLGQELLRVSEPGVQNRVFDMDLSAAPNGVYFVEISNGTDRIIKKVVISR